MKLDSIWNEWMGRVGNVGKSYKEINKVASVQDLTNFS